MDKDKELLELAAKAAGELSYEHASEGGLYLSNGEHWNPLVDDGDALRLAVKLNISISFGFAATKINCEIYDWAEDEVKIDWKEDGRKDSYAATRRAITRAAAEIGKAL
jgi:hypothetical protein